MKKMKEMYLKSYFYSDYLIESYSLLFLVISCTCFAFLLKWLLLDDNITIMIVSFVPLFIYQQYVLRFDSKPLSMRILNKILRDEEINLDIDFTVDNLIKIFGEHNLLFNEDDDINKLLVYKSEKIQQKIKDESINMKYVIINRYLLSQFLKGERAYIDYSYIINKKAVQEYLKTNKEKQNFVLDFENINDKKCEYLASDFNFLKNFLGFN
jgi:hypothetical protein